LQQLGDYDQIAATWRSGLDLCNRFGIELFKIPGGGSLQWQPNDLMRAHNVIHSYCSSSKYHSKLSSFSKPYWLPRFEDKLKEYGIDKASRDCFTNFMYQIPTILGQAFTVTNTRAGWKGLCPPDTQWILRKCDQFESANFSDLERKRIVDVVNDTLIPEAVLSGMSEDARITEVLGDLVGDMTHKFNFHAKPTNHQRAIWWNTSGRTMSGVLQIRANEVKRRENVRLAAIETQKRKSLKVIADARKAEVDRLFLGNFAAFKIDRYHICYCSNDCSEVPVKRILSEDDDGWQGCPVDGCVNFYCARINCHKKLVAHVKICMQKL
jgi:hypothetical protein